jgi:hypothetical protein
MTELISPELAEYRARCLVQGYERHEKTQHLEPISGAWSARFLSHPWVRQADQEGWARDLRASVVFAIKQRIMAGVKPSEINPEDVMPKSEYVEHWRTQERKAAEGDEWRKANPNHPSIRGNMEIDPVALLRKLGITKPEAAE